MYKYKKLSEPYKIGKLTINNRFCVAPMGLDVYDSNGCITEEGVTYFAERAKGGFGLIFTGALTCDMKVDPFSNLAGTSPLYAPYGFMRSAIKMTDTCHRYGSKVFAQLTMGLGRNYEGLKAPSEVEIFGDPNKKAQALTIEEIHEKEQAVIQAASLMKMSGFDGVEVHALHWGYLLDQFAMSITNHRTDEYGGSLENRLRPAKEIIEGIKAACGSDFPVTIRLGLKSYIKGLNKASFSGEEEAGRTLEEGVEICKLLESYGYDALNVDAGVYDSFYYAAPPMYMPKGFTIKLARSAKKEVDIPILVGGSRIDEVDLCMQAVSDNTGDAVVLGRASLADPSLPRKIMEGKMEEIKPCIGCNACLHTMLSGADLYCAVNPTVGREDIMALHPALVKKNIVVIGGGLAGMEVAVSSACRGHKATIYEKTDKLGGNLLAAGAHDFKNDILRLVEWYKLQISKLGIEVKYNTKLTTKQIIDINPDVVVLTTGSQPVTLKFDGSDDKKVISCLDAIYDKEKVGNNIVIVGGGQIGCELAFDYAKNGKEVTIVEALDDILSSGASVPQINKMMINDIIEHYGIEVRKKSKLVSVDSTGANIQYDNSTYHIDADTIIMSVGFKPSPTFEKEFVGTGIEVYVTGDGRKVGDVRTTTADAYEIARRI